MTQNNIVTDNDLNHILSANYAFPIINLFITIKCG